MINVMVINFAGISVNSVIHININFILHRLTFTEVTKSLNKKTNSSTVLFTETHVKYVKSNC